MAAVVTNGVSTNWDQRRVLVTGATGLVGSWLTRWLVDTGAYVVAFVMDHDPQSEFIRSGTVHRCHVVDGRLEDYDTVERAINGHDIDTVFHLGAQTIVGTAQRLPRQTLESNIRGTWNVLDACRQLPGLIERIVVASSDKAYGSQSTLPYREDAPLIGRSPYDVSKSCADLISTSYALSFDLPILVARCGNIYGGGDLNWSRIVPGVFRWLIRGEQPVLRSDGTFLRDYIHVDDVVEAYVALADRAADRNLKGQAFNFSNEAPVSVWEMYRAICRAAGQPDVEPAVLGKADSEIKDQYLDAGKAHSELGWRARVTLDDGLERTFDWYHRLLRGES